MSRLGGGRSVDAALLRCAEGKPRARRDGRAGSAASFVERVAQRVLTSGHARRVDHGGWWSWNWNRAEAAHAHQARQFFQA